MQIKVFRAATMKEAMAEVKEALGDDAVILHTKKTKDGGIFGYGSKDIFEVTAAIDEETQASPEVSKEKINGKQNLIPNFLSNVSSDMPTIQPPKTVLSSYKTSGTKEGVELAENTVFEKKRRYK